MNPENAGNNGNNLTQIPKPTANSPKPSRRKWFLVGGGVVMLVLAIGGLLVSGVLYLGFKAPAQKVVVRTVVCGDDIGTFNSINSSSGGDFNKLKNDIDNLADKISKRTNADKDPDCQFILWYSARINQDSDKQMSTMKNIVSLGDSGYYVSGNLNGAMSISGMKTMTQGWIDLDGENANVTH
jgi:hypothetical protein